MKIHFRVFCPTRWGEQLYVSGSLPELGKWNTEKAIPLAYVPWNHWEISLKCPHSLPPDFEFRFFIKYDNGVIKEEGPGPRKIILDESTNELLITAAWKDPSDPNQNFASSAFTDVLFFRKTPASLPKTAVKKEEPEIPVKKTRLKSSRQTRVRFTFNVPRNAPEDSVYVTGDLPELGRWNPDKSLALEYQGNQNWSIELLLNEIPERLSYKYLFRNEKTGAVLFEDGENRTAFFYPLYVKPGKTRKKSSAASGEQPLILIEDQNFRQRSVWKGAGVAVPIFSLRTEKGLGIGEFLDLKPFADWASECGLRLIQILPVNDTSVHGDWRDSYPYSPLSVFALHPIYLHLDSLAADDSELLRKIESRRAELNRLKVLDYEKVLNTKLELLDSIFEHQKAAFMASKEAQSFIAQNSHWLKTYAAFSYLKGLNKTGDFCCWGEYAKITESGLEALTSPEAPHYEAIVKTYFIQYHLHLQLKEASSYCARKKVVLKGDIPIGLNKWSDSCWRHPEWFNRTASAGAPPDPFSDTGQNWGFPTYHWEAMRKDNYSWWRARLKQMSRYFQMIRLDHVLGFFRIWEIPEEMVLGLLGHFNPCLTIAKDELERRGVHDFERLCKPWITRPYLETLFGKETPKIIEIYLEEQKDKTFRLKPKFESEKKIETYVENSDLSKDEKQKLKTNLFRLVSNFLFFRDPGNPENSFYPRINMTDTQSFSALEDVSKEALRTLYYDYFYHRQNDFWRAQAMIKLPVIKTSSSMLIAGEDLGMVPDCVRPVMEELSILGLRIQRMPPESDREFGNPYEYPYLTVATTSSHDMPTLRGWWEEKPVRSKRFYETVLKRRGKAPEKCEPWIVREIILQHLESNAMWTIFPLQDILALSPELRKTGDPADEQINHPENPNHYWRYRMHLTVETLLESKAFRQDFRSMVEAAERLEPV